MKRHLMLLVAAMVLVVAASPAMAAIVYTPQPLTGQATVGLIDPNNLGTLNTVYVTSGSGAGPSDTFVFTFGIHFTFSPLATGYNFKFAYDNNSIEVLHANNVHPTFSLNNFVSLGTTDERCGRADTRTRATSTGDSYDR